jgi:hypothetical protein
VKPCDTVLWLDVGFMVVVRRSHCKSKQNWEFKLTRNICLEDGKKEFLFLLGMSPLLLVTLPLITNFLLISTRVTDIYPIDL